MPVRRPRLLAGTLRNFEYQPCIPTRGTKVPSGRDWFHEIKHDGYRLIVQPEGKRVRLLTRRGYGWSDRYPLIVEVALGLRKSSFVIDGEAVVLGSDAISDFEGLHSGRCNEEARLYAFDLLSDDGVDMREETLQIRRHPNHCFLFRLSKEKSRRREPAGCRWARSRFSSAV